MTVAFKLRVPISVKLIGGTISMILAVVIPIALQSSDLFEQKLSENQKYANSELADSKSTEVDALILNYLEKARTMRELLLKDSLGDVLSRDLDLVSVEIYELQNGRAVPIKRAVNEAFLSSMEVGADLLSRVRREIPVPLAQLFASAERIQIQNASVKGGAPLFTLGIPFPDRENIVRHVVVANVRLDRLQRAFASSGPRLLYLVDSEGRLLAHPDETLIFERPSFKDVPIVEYALSQGQLVLRGEKTRFVDPTSGGSYVGAFSRTSFGPTVIAQASESVILEPARLVRVSAYSVAGYAISAAIFLVILFSVSLTLPIEKLHEATLMVAQGNFNVTAKVRSSDEVGALATSFNSMVEGLREREKVKTILNKFHGSSVTEDLLKGDLALRGSRKDVTVFFSDIRGFTKFSEGHTPEEVVEMLNEYFHVMVGIITANHGVVDKFVGDAIMAVWGAPQSTGADAHYAVKACIEMRAALATLNETRASRGQSAILVGMGVHTGPAISGTIGSTERMEYTVIGDTVNMASRIESSTKAFGTDLLISESTVEALGGTFLVELAGSAEVKGKSAPIQMFRVNGFYDAQGNPIEVRTPYSVYEAEAADKVKVA